MFMIALSDDYVFKKNLNWTSDPTDHFMNGIYIVIYLQRLVYSFDSWVYKIWSGDSFKSQVLISWETVWISTDSGR